MKILLFSIILLSATMGFCQGRNSINIEIDGNHHVNMANGPDNNSVAKTESPTNTYGIEDNIFEFDLRDKNSSDRPPHINIYYKSGVTNRENRPPHIHIYCPCGVDGPENNRRPPPLDFYIAGENEYSQRQDPLNNSGAKTESPTNTYGVEENIFEFDLRGENSRDQAPHIKIYYLSGVYGTGNNRGKSPLLINVYYQPGVFGPEIHRNPQLPPVGPSVYMPSQPWPHHPFRTSGTSAEQPTNSYGMGGANINRNPQPPPLGPSGELWNSPMNTINPNFPTGNYRTSTGWHNGPPLPEHGTNDPDYVNYINRVNPGSNFPARNNAQSTNAYYGSGFGGFVNNIQPPRPIHPSVYNSQPWLNHPFRNSRTNSDPPRNSYEISDTSNIRANTEPRLDASGMGASANNSGSQEQRAKTGNKSNNCNIL